MLNQWTIVISIVIVINLLNFIWLTNIKYKRTLARRKRWKRRLSLLFFAFSPVVFVFNLLTLPFTAYLNFLLGALGTWFGVSQLRFAQKHSAVPQIVEPLSTFYFILGGFLLLLGALKIA